MGQLKRTIAIVGSGFGGAVIARALADSGNYRVVVFEEREHPAGNCHTERDSASGILIHKYGPHIFHTDRADVWNYVRSFGEFAPYTNRVKAITERGVFSMPINLLTINQFFQKQLTPAEAEVFVSNLGDKSITHPRNFEEQALRMIGPDLYRCFFYGYTKKQWGIEPRELPASILKRLPLRFSYDDNYYNSRFQGIPVEGYTTLVERILRHTDIEVRLGTRFEPGQTEDFLHTFYSGPIDGFFGHRLGRLNYRTLDFKRMDAEGDYQGNPVLNYCDAAVPFTRVTEHKHFAPQEKHRQTVVFHEYSRQMGENDIAYYPMRLDQDKALLAQYIALAEETPNLSFVGRLGTYRYLDMHAVIGESLDLSAKCLQLSHTRWPKFSGESSPLVSVSGGTPSPIRTPSPRRRFAAS